MLVVNQIDDTILLWSVFFSLGKKGVFVRFIIVILAMLLFIFIIDNNGAAERAALQTQREKYSARLLDEQDTILVGLVAMNDPVVNELVNDWRMTYPNPLPKDLSALKLVEQKIKNNKADAVKMTKAYKQENNPFCSGEVQSIVGKKPDCPPG